MRQLITDNAELRKFIPNVIFEVEEEATLFDKVKPHLDAAALWLEQNIVDDDIILTEKETGLAKSFVAHAAMKDAIPSLDLVLTPNGFGIVSTSEIAPASKERVQNLISSMQTSSSMALFSIVRLLHQSKEWRESARGMLFCSTFVSYFDQASHVTSDYRQVMDDFKKSAEIAAVFEAKAANWLGSGFIVSMRSAYVDETALAKPQIMSLLGPMLDAERRYIERRKGATDYSAHPEPHEIWHLVEPVLTIINNMASVPEEWGEIPGLQQVKPFENDVKGGYWF